jgi:hypothetical protein
VIPALNAPAIRSVGEVIWPRLLHNEACPSWALSESRVRPSLEEALGRGLDLNRAHQSLRFVLMVVTSRV